MDHGLAKRLHELLGPQLLQMALEKYGQEGLDIASSWLNMGSL